MHSVSSGGRQVAEPMRMSEQARLEPCTALLENSMTVQCGSSCLTLALVGIWSTPVIPSRYFSGRNPVISSSAARFREVLLLRFTLNQLQPVFSSGVSPPRPLKHNSELNSNRNQRVLYRLIFKSPKIILIGQRLSQVNTATECKIRQFLLAPLGREWE